MHMTVINIPTVLWTNNKDSIMRRQDPERDAATKDDFLNAMLLSAEFVTARKGYVEHLQNTVESMTKNITLNENEAKKLNLLLKYIRR